MKKNEKIEECPVKFLSLSHVLRQYIDAGILGEHDVCHPGIGRGKYATYKGNKIKIKRKVKGKPGLEHNYGESFQFHEPHDIAYCPVTNKMICYALSI